MCGSVPLKIQGDSAMDVGEATTTVSRYWMSVVISSLHPYVPMNVFIPFFAWLLSFSVQCCMVALLNTVALHTILPVVE